MAINRLEIKNFTVFDDIEMDFSSGVNIFIGENGTGKTHLLKCIYAEAYQEKSGQVSLMSGFDSLEDVAPIFGVDRQTMYMLAKDASIQLKQSYNSQNIVFIPAKDMLTHSKGLIEMAKKYSKAMPFDKTLLDIIEKSKQWKLDEIPNIAKNIIPRLENIIGGKVLVENDTFYVQKENEEKIEFSVEAEGIKKIGLLWQLLMNESITKNTVLLWDEPESNINPKIIPDIVEILLELSRQGVQVFIATHDYVLAKYFEVKSNGTDIIFHSLYKTDNGIKCESSAEFRNLKNNAILKAFDVLMDEVIDRNLGE